MPHSAILLASWRIIVEDFLGSRCISLGNHDGCHVLVVANTVHHLAQVIYLSLMQCLVARWNAPALHVWLALHMLRLMVDTT